jgi:hypothetical protein
MPDLGSASKPACRAGSAPASARLRASSMFTSSIAKLGAAGNVSNTLSAAVSTGPTSSTTARRRPHGAAAVAIACRASSESS